MTTPATPLLLLCLGTRPEIIKMAPLYHALRSRGVTVVLLHTGQHTDLADPMYDFFDMRPDCSLQLDHTARSLAHLSALLIEKIGATLLAIAPTAVLVHGDTSSALMASMAAFYQKVPVAHVEAGLRSHRTYDPFPEEKNRELIARLASWHFAPTDQAAHNLRSEGIPGDAIHVVGNTVVDAVALGQQRLRAHPQWLDAATATLRQRLAGQRVIVVTAHRRENWGEPLSQIARAVLQIVKAYPDVAVVWPVHANPAVRQTVHAELGQLGAPWVRRVFLVPPLSYPMMLDLLSIAWLVLSDSGGIQEEAVSVGVPILVLRNTTERPELIEVGAGRLIGTEQQAIVRAVGALWGDTQAYRAMRGTRNPFGDGLAAQRIADLLLTQPTKG